MRGEGSLPSVVGDVPESSLNDCIIVGLLSFFLLDEPKNPPKIELLFATEVDASEFSSLASFSASLSLYSSLSLSTCCNLYSISAWSDSFFSFCILAKSASKSLLCCSNSFFSSSATFNKDSAFSALLWTSSNSSCNSSNALLLVSTWLNLYSINALLASSMSALASSLSLLAESLSFKAFSLSRRAASFSLTAMSPLAAASLSMDISFALPSFAALISCLYCFSILCMLF